MPWFLSVDSAGSGSFDPLFALAQYGLLGLILILTATGYIRWKPEFTRLVEQMQRLEDKLDRHQKIYEDVVLPTLREANDNMTKINSYLWDIQRKAG